MRNCQHSQLGIRHFKLLFTVLGVSSRCDIKSYCKDFQKHVNHFFALQLNLLYIEYLGKNHNVTFKSVCDQSKLIDLHYYLYNINKCTFLICPRLIISYLLIMLYKKNCKILLSGNISNFRCQKKLTNENRVTRGLILEKSIIVSIFSKRLCFQLFGRFILFF